MSSASMKAVNLVQLAERFTQRYGTVPRLFRAPGRINIIGEHTDYSEGFVMPAAIDRWCVIAAAPNGTRRLRMVASAFAEKVDLDLDALRPEKDWSDYPAGVASILMADGIAVPGMDIWIDSDVPMGAGVSSSAAIEVAMAAACLAMAGETADRKQIARWTQAAENEFVGRSCGIMDQFASANGLEGKALMLDCRSLEATPASLPAGAGFLFVNSMVKHSHVEGDYRQRRADCEEASRHLGVPFLRDVSIDALPAALQKLSGTIARRCRHVVTENERVRKAALAMNAGDLVEPGRLMTQSHASLRDDFEVSVPEVDRLVEIACATEGVYGARMMGGGFGGSIIALVAVDQAEAVREAIVAEYADVVNKVPDAFTCRAVDGVNEVEL